MFGCCNNRCRCNNWFNNMCCPWQCQSIPQPIPYVLSGVVIGVDGLPVSGITISYVINGQNGMTVTDINGAYSITVPANASVMIQALPGLGVNVTPLMYNITHVNGNIAGLDFTLTVVEV